MTEDKSGPARLRRQAVSPDEAMRRILAHVHALPAERVDLSRAWGRTMAEPAIAVHPYPPFRRSGMDGYAVRAGDLPVEPDAGPVELQVLETLPAGVVPRHAVGPMQASRVMTGGMLPEGADAVVMQEMTTAFERDGASWVRINKPVPKGANVTEIGSEWRQGDILLPAGRKIGPGEAALLAAFGFARVAVVRRPRVGVLTTGSELLEVGDPLQPGRIRNTNAPMLEALLREAGADPIQLGRVPDRLDELETKVRESLAACDLLLTTGGVSVGDYDMMALLLASCGHQMLFNKVAMRPGSPTSAALLDGKLLLALSGNPGACFVGFHLFAAPAIRRMQRVDPAGLPRFTARLDIPFSKVNAYTRYVRSRLQVRDGSLWVRPAGEDKSSVMKSIPDSVCLMEIPPLREPLAQGSLVTVIPLREGIFG
jgi:molybdopterin molybdotransferase